MSLTSDMTSDRRRLESNLAALIMSAFEEDWPNVTVSVALHPTRPQPELLVCIEAPGEDRMLTSENEIASVARELYVFVGKQRGLISRVTYRLVKKGEQHLRFVTEYELSEVV